MKKYLLCCLYNTSHCTSHAHRFETKWNYVHRNADPTARNPKKSCTNDVVNYPPNYIAKYLHTRAVTSEHIPTQLRASICVQKKNHRSIDVSEHKKNCPKQVCAAARQIKCVSKTSQHRRPAQSHRVYIACLFLGRAVAILSAQWNKSFATTRIALTTHHMMAINHTTRLHSLPHLRHHGAWWYFAGNWKVKHEKTTTERHNRVR